jgi:OOP family OmpA-OmpF porin
MSKYIWLVGILGLVVGCSSGEKKTPISADTNQQVQRLEADIQAGYAGHFDVLAAKEFNQTLKQMKLLKKELMKNEESEEIASEIQRTHGLYQTAAAKAQERNQPAERITTARSKALTAGARNFEATKTDLKRLDDQVRSNIEDIEKMEPAEYAELQKGYLKIELAAIEETQLGGTKTALNEAFTKGARSTTPKAMRQAEFDLKNAQNQIATNRNYPERFAPAVAKALESADMLAAVMTTQTSNGQRLDETTATRIVLQSRQIGSLEGRLNDKEAQTQRERQELQEQALRQQEQAIRQQQDLLKQQQELQQKLRQQKRALNQASTAVALQNSIEQARQSFSEQEADVFQQGGKLLIRLKTMNFPSGRSDLPAEALAILAKVKSVAQGLGPDAVTVEGHTDSVGDAALNEKLSQKRAEAVAQYLSTTGIDSQKIQAIGYGFTKPISSNRTPVGRSQNRRVDVVITPAKAVPSNLAGFQNDDE